VRRGALLVVRDSTGDRLRLSSGGVLRGARAADRQHVHDGKRSVAARCDRNNPHRAGPTELSDSVQPGLSAIRRERSSNARHALDAGRRKNPFLLDDGTMKRNETFAVGTWVGIAFCAGVVVETFVLPRLTHLWIQLGWRAPVAQYLEASGLNALVWHWNGVWPYLPDYLVATALGFLVASAVSARSLMLAVVVGAGMFLQGAFWTTFVTREGYFPGVLPEVLIRSALVVPLAFLGGALVRLTRRWSGPA